MIIKDCITELEKDFPLQLKEDFDNVGLLCGDYLTEVKGILICHDTLESVVDEAIALDYNLIISFHPIIFSGIKAITGSNYVEKTIIKAIQNNIAIYAIHTAFDNHYNGVNFGICEKLGLKNPTILMPKNNTLEQIVVYVPSDFQEQIKNALFSEKAGNIGNYDQCSFSVSGNGTFRPLENAQPFIGTQNVRESVEEVMISAVFEKFRRPNILQAIRKVHPYEEVAYQIYALENQNPYVGLGMFGELSDEMDGADFLKYLKEKFSLKVIRHSKIMDTKIKKVAVLGGSGASGISAAIAQNCDAYISSDFKYHDFFRAEGRLLLCDIGHYESERFVTGQLFDILSKIFPKFAISKSSITTNPVNYFI